MKIAYFDCFAGIAGDMALAALLDCGVPLHALKTGLASLPVSGWDIEVEDVLRGGIHAKNVRVTLDGKSDEEEAATQSHAVHHDHHHDHGHKHHEHDHHHGGDHHHHKHDNHEHEAHEHGHHHHHEHVHGRSMAEIREIIEASSLTAAVKTRSLAIFEVIAKAEAYLHHSTPEEIHFHEIGGIDSLIDICGVAWCLDFLGVDEVYCSALPHSTGFVDCAHGRMPVPAPATLEILKDAAWVPTGLTGELVTPTGAGIVGALSAAFGPMPALSPETIGLGSGKKQLQDRPNLLRVVIGEKRDAPSQATDNPVNLPGLLRETLTVIECNIDDMNPEFYALVSEKLFDNGALDVWQQNIQMKKNRPAILLGVLCLNEKRETLVSLVLRETTTLGVRLREVERLSMPRSEMEVATDFGTVSVKITDWPEGAVWRVTPEYEDVARLAKLHDMPARQIYNTAVSAAQDARIDS